MTLNTITKGSMPVVVGVFAAGAILYMLKENEYVSKIRNGLGGGVL
jgi:hypothetical protein